MLTSHYFLTCLIRPVIWLTEFSLCCPSKSPKEVTMTLKSKALLSWRRVTFNTTARLGGHKLAEWQNACPENQIWVPNLENYRLHTFSCKGPSARGYRQQSFSLALIYAEASECHITRVWCHFTHVNVLYIIFWFCSAFRENKSFFDIISMYNKPKNCLPMLKTSILHSTCYKQWFLVV